MNSALLGLLAETAIHPGSGRDTGFVDLPVAREAATDYPVIVGSSFKGALLDLARSGMEEKTRETVFGKQDDAGNLVVSDARLLLLPVRSMSAHYKWVTCPHLLERFQRDAARAGVNVGALGINGPARKHYLGAGGEALFLEERQFMREGDLPAGLVDALSTLVCHDSTRGRLADQVVVLNDGDFVWFARYGLSINARNVLDEEKKTSKNLWYEETIPSDSLFYCLLAERNANAVDGVTGLFNGKPYIQAGGNASVGQGWFAVNVVNGGA